MIRRVCITGIGIVSPLGVGVDYVWKKIMSGMSGITTTDSVPFLKNRTKSRVIGLVPKGEEDGFFNANDPLFFSKTPRVNPKNLSLFIKYTIKAADEALVDSGLKDKITDPERVAVTIANGLGALDVIEEKTMKYAQFEGDDQNEILRLYTPYSIPAVLPNMGAGTVSMFYGLKGANRCINAACASGLYAIEDGVNLIRSGDADIVIAGASESVVSMMTMAGFDAMTALSRKYNHAPETASRPYDKGRDGFVFAEGCGVLILERMDLAQERGAKIYAEYLGCGLTSDAYNVSAPSGEGSLRAMKIALDKSNVNASDIDYIGVHATSTPLGDRSEIESIRALFNDKIPTLSAVKSSVGHMLSAASGVETVLLMKMMETGEIPPTLNVYSPEDFMDGIDYVPDIGRKQNVNIALKNSFGFGGANAAMIFKNMKSNKNIDL